MIVKELFPEDSCTFGFNSIRRKHWRSFVNHPDAISLISSTEDISAKRPTNTGLVDNFKFTFSPVDSFKNSIKINAGILTTFKEGKYWDAWRRNTLATTKVQDAAEVLNLHYRTATADDVNLFKKKQKFVCAVFDKMLQTDRGNKYVREHESYYNAQIICQKLSAFRTK